MINPRGRLALLVEMHAPEIIVRNERRMLKAAVEHVFEIIDIEEVIASGSPTPPTEGKVIHV